jgi:hypothetical protein
VDQIEQRLGGRVLRGAEAMNLQKGKGDCTMKNIMLGVAIAIVSMLGFVIASHAGETSATMEKMKGEAKATTEEVKGQTKGAVEDVKGNKMSAEAERTKGKAKAETERAKGKVNEVKEKAK